MKGFRCWSAGDVRATVYSDIGALPSNADAVFLAAHTPVTLLHMQGVRLDESAPGEKDIERALRNDVGDETRNTLIAITGDSGAGKSHVVRWVNAELPRDDSAYHVLYVPRAVQTIRQLLRVLVAGLPDAGGDEFIRRVDQAISNASPAEMRDRVLAEMRIALKWKIENRPPVDGETLGERDVREARNFLLGEFDTNNERIGGLGDLLRFPQIDRALSREDGRVQRLVKSWTAETSRRDEASESFTLDDLPLREAGIRNALRGDPALAELWSVVKDNPEPVLGLLNEALPHAARASLGLRAGGAETLDALFRRSRQALRTAGKELVLLFEDLAQFGLIDGELYDQFATPPGEDMAPLRVLFAVTDGAYNTLPPTVRTRIDHRFKVTADALSDRHAFLARYLNLVRLGREQVEKAWASRTQGQADWVANACDTREGGAPCVFRETCHAGFDTVEVNGLGTVGLYPYNPVALEHAIRGRATQTPRELMDVCITEVLLEADRHIETGTYPHARVRDQFHWGPIKPRQAVVGGGADEATNRLYLAKVLWGNEGTLRPAVLEAFALRDDAVQTATTVPTTIPAVGGGTQPTAVVGQDDPLIPLWQWENGDELRDEYADEYREILRTLLLGRLNLDQELVAASGQGMALLNESVSRTRFGIFGSRGDRPGVPFRLVRNHDDVQVLAGAKWYHDHGHWIPSEGRWPWPSGYDPLDLMLALESRLDAWADDLRGAFLASIRGRGLPGAAAGIRAIALVGLGRAPAGACDPHAELGPAPPASGGTSLWTAAEKACRDVARQPKLTDTIQEFAAVRQGARGAPQLVDAVAMRRSIEEALDGPEGFLRTVQKHYKDVGPHVAEAARTLLQAFESAASSALDQLAGAVASVQQKCGEASPDAVAKAARGVGRRALDGGLLRPANSWSQFQDAADRLSKASPDLLTRSAPEARTVDAALSVQGWSREMLAAAQDLGTLTNALDQTREECKRSSEFVGDLADLETRVKTNLQSVEQALRGLRVPGSEGGR